MVREMAIAMILFGSAMPVVNAPQQTTSVSDIEGSKAGVTAPKLLHQESPKYSKEARKKKISGTVKVRLIIDKQGTPQDVTVADGLGYGLDEAAVDAVRKYRFQPAMKDGAPVKVEMLIAVNFKIY